MTSALEKIYKVASDLPCTQHIKIKYQKSNPDLSGVGSLRDDFLNFAFTTLRSNKPTSLRSTSYILHFDFYLLQAFSNEDFISQFLAQIFIFSQIFLGVFSALTESDIAIV